MASCIEYLCHGAQRKDLQVHKDDQTEDVDSASQQHIELKYVARSCGHLAIVFTGQEHKPREVVDKTEEVK